METKWNVEIPVIPDVNLSDFAFFLAVMENREAYECVLSIITGEPELELKQVKVEQVVLNQKGKRAIRLDAWAVDWKDRQFNTEMQNDTDHDDVRKRSRYYQGLMDSPILKAGKKTKYRSLPPTMIIFITQDDIFKRDLAKYTFTEQCEEIPGLYLEDGTAKVFLNMSSKNGAPELVSLLQYMKCTTLDNPEIIVMDRRIVKLDSIVNEVKQSVEWEDVKMSIYSVGIEQGIERGREIGARNTYSKSILMAMKKFGAVSHKNKEKVCNETDVTILESWLEKAIMAESLDEFEEVLWS